MATQLVFKGLEDLRASLRRLPVEGSVAAGRIVQGAGAAAAADVAAAYPQGPTGNLKAGVVLETRQSRFGAVAIVRSRAKHAWIYERGTVDRENARGADRGRMPKGNAFIPALQRHRRQMEAGFVQLLRDYGLEVLVS